jgi:glycosyltransferase involved in cell wall biosynthesis
MLNNEFPPLGGGTGTVTEALLRRFSEFDSFHVDLVTSTHGTDREELHYSSHTRLIKVPVGGGDIHHASNRDLLTYAVGAYREAKCQHAAHPYDCCLAWSSVPAGVVAWTLWRVFGLPYVVRVSGPDIPGFERRYQWLYPLLTPVIRMVWRNSNVVIAKCRAESEMILQTYPAAKVAMVANGVDLDTFYAGDRPAVGPLRIVCVARLIERKGQHQLLRAVRTLADAGVAVSVELVGTGDARESLEQLVKALDLSATVSFAGYVPRSEIPEHYARAHVFVLPTYNEGMSIATLEAMAAGLPIVSTSVGGLAELVTNGVNGLTFQWGDVDGLAARLAQLASDRELAARMGVAARAIAASFSWNSMTSKYVALLESIANSDSHRN